ncbi:MAG: hypothetical protein WAK39_12695 [Pseudolabrys sp.]
MATKDHDAVIIFKEKLGRGGALFERNPYFRVCSLGKGGVPPR